MKINILIIVTILGIALYNTACKKYLDAKPDQKLVVPTTLKDLQALLDNTSVNNESSPSADEASADNYYLLKANYDALSTLSQKAYGWENYDYTVYPNDWSIIYNGIYPSNVVLSAIGNIEKTELNQADWNNAKGSALFFRSQGFLRAAFIFCKSYDESTANDDLGIVLRQTPDFTEKSVRANLKDTYTKIITDLKEAASLLPITPKHVLRPSKPAAFALLARTYMSMRDYDNAYKYADSCLQLKNDLMNYATETSPTNATRPIQQFNKEVIFSSILGTYVYNSVVPGTSRVDSILYNSYSNNDMRKTVFFRDATTLGSTGYIFKGTYDGSYTNLFIGIATDEVWLMRAECSARLGNKNAALGDLNTLMQKRWNNNGTWIPFSASTAQDALNLILTERRKELIFRGLRWMDIKRLNKEGANIILKRVMNGQTYTLSPNDLRYALLLPQDIINLTGMPQNER
jgi:tetratricopeptide (TPR) repeat protein